MHNDPINHNDPTGELIAVVAGGPGVAKIFGVLWSAPGIARLFGQGRKDPIVEAWKNNPGAQVAAVDRRIAEAREEGEQQDRRYIAALKVVGDCYTKAVIGGGWIRRFTYQAVDQFGEGFAKGEYSVTEQNVVVQGDLTSGNATWGPNNMRADGTFRDYVGKMSVGLSDIVQYQTFTATMLNSAGFAPGAARQVMVSYDGYGPGAFGVWGHWMTNGGVRTNNYFYHPEKGRTICEDEPYFRF